MKALKKVHDDLGLTSRLVSTPIVTEICRRYVDAKEPDAFQDRQTRTIVTIDGVRNAHRADMPSDGEVSRSICGTFCCRVYSASLSTGSTGSASCRGLPSFFQDGDAVALNLWTPPNIVAVSGDVTPFIDHLDYIFDGDLIANGYILDFLPRLVQKPWIKMRIAPLIIGEPEIGKSAIWFRSSLANRTQRQSRKVVCDRRSTSGSMAYSSSL